MNYEKVCVHKGQIRKTVPEGTWTAWSEKSTQMLIDLVGEGYMYREIADKMGKTYMSVRSKVGRLQEAGRLGGKERAGERP